MRPKRPFQLHEAWSTCIHDRVTTSPAPLLSYVRPQALTFLLSMPIEDKHCRCRWPHVIDAHVSTFSHVSRHVSAHLHARVSGLHRCAAATLEEWSLGYHSMMVLQTSPCVCGLWRTRTDVVGCTVVTQRQRSATNSSADSRGRCRPTTARDLKGPPPMISHFHRGHKRAVYTYRRSRGGPPTVTATDSVTLE